MQSTPAPQELETVVDAKETPVAVFRLRRLTEPFLFIGRTFKESNATPVKLPIQLLPNPTKFNN
jgi:hypothetical protein